jgi:hypothetical protein
MALGSTQLLTEMSTGNLPGVKGRPARKADNFTAFSRLSRKCGRLDVSQTAWASTARYKDSFSFAVLE